MVGEESLRGRKPGGWEAPPRFGCLDFFFQYNLMFSPLHIISVHSWHSRSAGIASKGHLAIPAFSIV